MVHIEYNQLKQRNYRNIFSNTIKTKWIENMRRESTINNELIISELAWELILMRII